MSHDVRSMVQPLARESLESPAHLSNAFAGSWHVRRHHVSGHSVSGYRCTQGD